MKQLFLMMAFLMMTLVSPVLAQDPQEGMFLDADEFPVVIEQLVELTIELRQERDYANMTDQQLQRLRQCHAQWTNIRERIVLKFPSFGMTEVEKRIDLLVSIRNRLTDFGKVPLETLAPEKFQEMMKEIETLRETFQAKIFSFSLEIDIRRISQPQ